MDIQSSEKSPEPDPSTDVAEPLPLRCAEDTERLGELFGRTLAEAPPRSATVFALIGPLGAGKTTFVRGLARGLGLRDVVKSPSFTLHDQHIGPLTLDHFDAYFVADPEELMRNGLGEFLAAAHVIVIEWADRVATELPADRLEIRLAHRTGGRICAVRPFGSAADLLWERVRSRRLAG